jgi:CheY-like chemotaxis protein/HPt (histidine-containing phosphotransfer) domain-containing protein
VEIKLPLAKAPTSEVVVPYAAEPVLVVADESIEREFLCEMLVEMGLAPTLASTREAAKTAIQHAEAHDQRFPFALVDAEVSGSDGLALVHSLLAGLSTAIWLLAPAVGRRSGRHSRGVVSANAVVAELSRPFSERDIRRALTSKLSPSRMEHPPLPEKPLLRRPLRVLLAEDAEFNRLLVVRILEKAGHQVVEAVNGQLAVEAFERERFDMILMDIQMPLLSGFDATAAIRDLEKVRGGHIPIVAVTAHAMRGDRERCLAGGMDAYLTKPIRAQKLLELVESLAPGHEAIGLPIESAPEDAAEATSVESAPGEATENDAFNAEGALNNAGGDSGLLTDLAELFSATYPETLAEAGAALGRGDANELSRIAHKLKGSVSNFCATRARAAAESLEHLARDNDLDQASVALDSLRTELAQLERALRALTRLAA